MNKKVWWKGFFWSINLLFLVILLGFSGVASATTMNAENLDTLAAGETINGNINGDLFVAAQSITINGTAAGRGYPTQPLRGWSRDCAQRPNWRGCQSANG